MSATQALLLMNLGSPDSPSVPDVRRYLNEFLMDSRVLDFPAPFRWLLVRGIITPFRSPRSAAAYRKVWRSDGSPLIVMSQALCDAVQQKVDFPVSLAMRYGTPSPRKAFDQLIAQHPHLEEVTVFPLYPHYTMSSYETAVAYAQHVHRKNGYPFQLKFIAPFYRHPEYIAALATSIRPYLAPGNYDRILFSYHGLPERHMRKDDEQIDRVRSGRQQVPFDLPAVNYQKQCHETTRLTAAALGLKEGSYETSFQSRLKQAGNEWIKPYTALRLTELPGEGVRNLLVVCPAFISDCLETLEEIEMEGKKSFEASGGHNLSYIPCLNAQEHWVDTVVRWVTAANHSPSAAKILHDL